MATNFDGLRGTKEVMEAIEAKTKLLKLADGRAAFGMVELFDAVDLAAALRFFIGAKDRVAVIVFEKAIFENQIQGTDLWTQQTRTIQVMVSDRVIDRDPRKALLGAGAGEHPGTLALADLALTKLSGLLLENPRGVFLRPIALEPMVVNDAEQKEMPGRRGDVVTFEARGGLITSDLGKGPIQ